jgi:hypothetical protein
MMDAAPSVGVAEGMIFSPAATAAVRPDEVDQIVVLHLQDVEEIPLLIADLHRHRIIDNLNLHRDIVRHQIIGSLHRHRDIVLRIVNRLQDIDLHLQDTDLRNHLQVIDRLLRAEDYLQGEDLIQ